MALAVNGTLGVWVVWELRGSHRAFTLVELAIVMLILSGLGLGVSHYLRNSTKNLAAGDIQDQVRSSGSLLQRLLSEDLQQVAFINPSCTTNAAPGASVSTVCSDIKVRGGVVPYPDLDKDGITAATSLAAPANISASTNSLSNTSDSLRLAQFDFSDNFNCKYESLFIRFKV